nr:MBL fold metallo-hydrolase [Lysinibacillus timonensis]
MIQFQNDQLTIFESALYKTTSTVVKTKDCIIVVDPNLLPSEVEEIRAHVSKIRGRLPVYLVLTHSDWDHLIGYGAFQDTTVIASQLFQTLDSHQIVEQMKTFDDKYYLDRNYEITFPKVNIPISKERHVSKIGSTTMTFYSAPGHTKDGIFTVIEPYGIFIAGDYLSDIEFPFIYDNSYHYELTLKKVSNILKNHKVNMLIPGHGNYTLSKDEIVKRTDESAKYIQELRRALSSNGEHADLISQYQYWRELNFSHEENVVLMRRELNNK